MLATVELSSLSNGRFVVSDSCVPLEFGTVTIGTAATEVPVESAFSDAEVSFCAAGLSTVA